MNGPTATGWLLVLFIAVGILWDLFALWCWGIEATVSAVLLGWARRHPIIPFVLGVLVGHLFWSQR